MTRPVLSAVVLFLCTAGAAQADPVTLTSGSVSIYWDGFQDSVIATGNNFSVAGTGEGSQFFYAFAPGQTINLSGTYSFAPSSIDIGGSVTDDGTTYRGYLRATFHVQAAPITFGGGSGQYRDPFTMTALFEVFSHIGDAAPAFSVTATGGGHADFSTDPWTDGGGLARGLAFFFDPPAGAQTPEPASLLLLGTGMAAVLARRRSRRRC